MSGMGEQTPETAHTHRVDQSCGWNCPANAHDGPHLPESSLHVEVEHLYKPGDKALILFSDGLMRPAQLSRGFIWLTADGQHRIFAEGGFDAQPLLRVVRCPGCGHSCCSTPNLECDGESDVVLGCGMSWTCDREHHSRPGTPS